MEIKILTFHRAFNFGAFLQAFALKSFLEKEGHQVSFVDYWPDEHAKRYALFRKECVTSVSSFVREVVLAVMRFPRYRSMRKLQCRYLGVSSSCPQYHRPEQLGGVQADAVVYGSDQIWWKAGLGSATGFDTAYWGEHIGKSIRKVAYAPSMGVMEVNDDDRRMMKGFVQNFSFLSAREEGLKDLLNTLSDAPVPVVLDPTLLLPASFWASFCKPIKKGKYILYYKVMGTPEADRLAEEIGRQRGLPVVRILGSLNTYRSVGMHSLRMDSFRLIAMIRDAELVLSTSFHGTAFSILFEKQFYAMDMGNNSGRVSSLLGLLGIGDRLIDVHSFRDVPAIDYTVVNERLELLRRQSAGYLINALR